MLRFKPFHFNHLKRIHDNLLPNLFCCQNKFSSLLTLSEYGNLRYATSPFSTAEFSSSYLKIKELPPSILISSQRYFSTEDSFEDKHSTAEGEEEKKVLYLRGLPFSATKEDVVKFFDGVEILNNGVNLITRDGRPTGVAYIELASQDDILKALKKHNQHMGSRYIEVFLRNESEINQIERYNSYREERQRFPPRYENRPRLRDNYRSDDFVGSGRGYEGRPRLRDNNFNDDYVGGRGGGSMGEGGASAKERSKISYVNYEELSHCVVLKGISYRATESDIEKFFHPLNPLTINIQMNTLKQPSGFAYVEFATHEEAVKAMNKDREYIKDRYVELVSYSRPARDEREA